ncbi:proline racemase family protein [Thalassoglobus sp.]|uniref:proline racemase family protein n=1 Tax=Thalassoglobus sp. TaxID=2795869 RepID=UPI003AA93699
MSPFSDDAPLQRVGTIETHTGGEPTRVVISGGPDLGTGSLAEQTERFRDQFDEFRSAVVNEPRGSDVMVGALLRPPVEENSVAGVIFFNNVGPLQMCGHGTIGVAVALAYLNRVQLGRHQLDTPVGTVAFELLDTNRVTIQNVPAYRYRSDVEVHVEGLGQIRGEIAWGGNWFFLVNDHEQDLNINNVETLTKITWAIRQALTANGITGENGKEIDHVELFGPPVDPQNDSRNFVLCPGKAYDRSPCGTGTSAKLACLYADGKLAAGEIYRQESIIGSLFEGSVQEENGKVIPSITGTAYVNAETTLILDLNDPFRFGIRS